MLCIRLLLATGTTDILQRIFNIRLLLQTNTPLLMHNHSEQHSRQQIANEHT